METAPPISPRNYEVPTVNTQHKDPKHTNSNAFNRIASWMTANSSQHDEESVQDFHESEWTPPDSSYGAAIPLFGWIPKNTRRHIEFTILLILVLGLVYLVVMLSIMISEARRDDSLAEDKGLGLDDDRYIGYADDSTRNYDDDPYWSSGYGGRRLRYF